jgi:hypothetical protein
VRARNNGGRLVTRKEPGRTEAAGRRRRRHGARERSGLFASTGSEPLCYGAARGNGSGGYSQPQHSTRAPQLTARLELPSSEDGEDGGLGGAGECVCVCVS